MNSLITCRRPFGTLSGWLDDFANESFFERTGREITSTSWPNIDVTEEEGSYRIRADLPGLDKKDIHVNVENSVLSITGEKKQENEKREKGRYFYLERSYGRFHRSFALPEHVDPEKIDAVYNKGVLELTLKKNEKAKPKAIDVKVS